MKYKLIGTGNTDYPIETILENRNISLDLFDISDDVIEDYNNFDNIQEGVELLIKHLGNKSNIEMVADTDVDGATSNAILYNYIKEVYPNANLRILMHTGKQHGLSSDIHISENTNLVICTDSSSNDYEQHKQLKDKNIDILVLDHHHCDGGYSPYATVINNQLSQNIKNKDLCGAGVVYKFIKAMDDYLYEDKADTYLDLVALGNIADMMDLHSKETRHLVYKGIANVNNAFLQALIEHNKFDLDGKMNIEKIGWVLSPKLNGTIRSGSFAEKSKMYKAFNSDDFEECLDVANMCKNVKSRQDNAVKSSMKDILKFANTDKTDRVLIINVGTKLSSTHTGLVANKLIDKFGIPVMLYRVKNGIASGSQRCPDSISQDFRNDLLNSGLMIEAQGHGNASGFVLKEENIEKLREYLNQLYKDKEVIDGKEYQVDFTLSEYDDIEYIVNELSKYENEWGNGIDAPLVAFEGIELNLTREDNLKGKLNIVFYIGGVKFIKKFSTNILKEELLDKSVTVNIVGKCTVDAYNSKGQVEIVDIEVI